MKKLLEIQTAIAQWELVGLKDEAKYLTSSVNYYDQQLSKIIQHVEIFDVKRGLFSDRPAKACPCKLPTFGGQDHEDLLTFKDKFSQAAADNKIWRADQVEKL